MKRAIVAVVSAGVLLAGCGGNPQERARNAYCDALRARQATFGEMAGSNDPAILVEKVPMLEELGAKAPADLTDEWQTFLNALKELRRVLAAAHVKPGEFGPGKVPGHLTVAQLRTIQAAASDLSSDDVVAAANGIEQQARDVCHLQLGL